MIYAIIWQQNYEFIYSDSTLPTEKPTGSSKTVFYNCKVGPRGADLGRTVGCEPKAFRGTVFYLFGPVNKSCAMNVKNFQNLYEMKIKEYNPGSEVKSKILPKIQCV